MGEIVEFMKNRDALLCKARRSKTILDKKAAKRARNKVNKLIKNAKNGFIGEQINNNQDNPKKFLKEIESVYLLTKTLTPYNCKITKVTF